MASSSATNLSKTYGQRRFAETNPRTLVGLHKADVQLKKMVDTLEQQQNTSVSNIANHQQALKMSWRRLEERRSASPLLTTREKKNAEQSNSSKRGMLLQSNTRLYTEKTPEIYNVTDRPATAAEYLTVSPPTGTQGENKGANSC